VGLEKERGHLTDQPTNKNKNKSVSALHLTTILDARGPSESTFPFGVQYPVRLAFNFESRINSIFKTLKNIDN
jgi:hypothetical protein